MLKKINDLLAGVPATIVAGLFLLLDLVPHLVEEFGGTALQLNLLPFDPAWVTIIISGIPMVYLAVWRVIYNPGISKISSALLISRQDAAVMLLQAAAAVGAEVLPIDGLMYADADQISTYARLAIQWTSQVRDSVTGKPVMAGVGGGRFDPLGNYTREQAMLTALRLFRS